MRLLFLLILAITSYANGAAFPWLEEANTQLVILQDRRVDFALRLKAIQRAKHSIDFVTFHQNLDDEFGMPFIQARRDASQRGVGGRAIISRLGSVPFDPLDRATALLADSNLASPSQVIPFGFASNILKGINFTDKLHEKILIIDGGTPDEIIFKGGPNQSSIDLKNLDFAYALRRIDPQKPYLGDQIRDAYDDLWNDAQAFHSIKEPRPVRLLSVPPLQESQVDALLLSNQQKRLFEELNQLLLAPVLPQKSESRWEVRPRKARLLTNGFLKNLRSRVFGNRFQDRVQMPNSIVDAAIEAIDSAQWIELSSMILAFPDGIFEALGRALQRKVPVTIWSNSRDSISTFVPWGIPFDLIVSQILRLMKFGPVRARLMSKKLAQFEGLPDYIKGLLFTHKKLLVTDRFVFTGSENFNLTGVTRSSEISAQFDDPEFSNYIKSLSEEDALAFEDFTCEMALTEAKSNNFLKRLFNWIALSAY